MSTASTSSRVGCVAIGRNEGERLKRCLRSLVGRVSPLVYVDSSSSDDSVAFARSLGVDVVELDMTVPFTAARARNAGIARLQRLAPNVPFVQVIDADCEMVEGFVEAATAVIEADATLAVVCGRRLELNPDASPYNRLCDMEWNTKAGEAEACGGDALLRLAAFDAVGGYDGSLIAGEEPDMCMRMRQAGYRILRIDRDMTRHDAAMSRFRQWWRRSIRAGHACAEGHHRHPNDARYAKLSRSNWFWGLLLPATVISLAWPTHGGSGVLLAGYGVLWLRVRNHRLRLFGDPPEHASLYARYCVLGKVPQMLGGLQFHLNQMRGKQSSLIEYKRA